MQYIFERDGEYIYKREFGQSERTFVGNVYDSQIDPRTYDGRPLHDHIEEDKLWGEIRRAARTNEVLHSALERVKILYHLSKNNGE